MPQSREWRRTVGLATPYANGAGEVCAAVMLSRRGEFRNKRGRDLLEWVSLSRTSTVRKLSGRMRVSVNAEARRWRARQIHVSALLMIEAVQGVATDGPCQKKMKSLRG
jgi:hypothetical protein